MANATQDDLETMSRAELRNKFSVGRPPALDGKGPFTQFYAFLHKLHGKVLRDSVAALSRNPITRPVVIGCECMDIRTWAMFKPDEMPDLGGAEATEDARNRAVYASVVLKCIACSLANDLPELRDPLWECSEEPLGRLINECFPRDPFTDRDVVDITHLRPAFENCSGYNALFHESKRDTFRALCRAYWAHRFPKRVRRVSVPTPLGDGEDDTLFATFEPELRFALETAVVGEYFQRVVAECVPLELIVAQLRAAEYSERYDPHSIEHAAGALRDAAFGVDFGDLEWLRERAAKLAATARGAADIKAAAAMATYEKARAAWTASFNDRETLDNVTYADPAKEHADKFAAAMRCLQTKAAEHDALYDANMARSNAASAARDAAFTALVLSIYEDDKYGGDAADACLEAHDTREAYKELRMEGDRESSAAEKQPAAEASSGGGRKRTADPRPEPAAKRTKKPSRGGETAATNKKKEKRDKSTGV